MGVKNHVPYCEVQAPNERPVSDYASDGYGGVSDDLTFYGLDPIHGRDGVEDTDSELDA